MKGDIKILYSDSIKALCEFPHHFEKREEAAQILNAYNPICGDRFQLFINPGDQRINDLYFHGFGCAISKASTSVLMRALEGKSFLEALEMCNGFLYFIRHGVSADGSRLPEDFLFFSGIRDFPERHDCATLSWVEMQKFLASKNNVI